MPGDWEAALDIGGTFTDLLLVNRRTGAFAPPLKRSMAGWSVQ